MAKRYLLFLTILVAVTLSAAQCSTVSAPETITKVETVVVEKAGEGETVTIVETVVVEKEVVITPTPQPTATPRPLANTFVFAVSAMELNMDPGVRLGTTTVRWARHFYDGLVQFKGATAEVEPALATEWEVSPDRKTYTFKLREGVKFHDGCEFNADAVKTSFDRIMGIGLQTAGIISLYQDTEIVDDSTVKIHLTNPDPAFLLKLPKIYMVSPCALEAHKTGDDPWAQDWFFDNEAGTGPFQLVEWIHGDRWISQRYDDYWAGPAKIDGTVSLLVNELGVQQLLLEGGEIDFALDITADSAKTMMENQDIDVEVTEGINLWMIMMNSKKGPLADKRVREAVRLAFDYESHIEFSLGGFGGAARGPVPPQMLGFNENIPQPQQNLERAGQLLAEAGYPGGGFTLKYIHLPADTGEELRGGEILRDALAKLGITLELQAADFAAKVGLFESPENSPDMAGMFAFPGSPDPSEVLVRFYRSRDVRPNAYNLAWLENSEIDELIAAQESETDPAVRQEMLNEIQRILWEDEIPAIWVSLPHSLTAHRTWVNGYEGQPFWHQTINVYDISLEGKP